MPRVFTTEFYESNIAGAATTHTLPHVTTRHHTSPNLPFAPQLIFELNHCLQNFLCVFVFVQVDKLLLNVDQVGDQLCALGVGVGRRRTFNTPLATRDHVTSGCD